MLSVLEAAQEALDHNLIHSLLDVERVARDFGFPVRVFPCRMLYDLTTIDQSILADTEDALARAAEKIRISTGAPALVLRTARDKTRVLEIADTHGVPLCMYPFGNRDYNACKLCFSREQVETYFTETQKRSWAEEILVVINDETGPLSNAGLL